MGRQEDLNSVGEFLQELIKDIADVEEASEESMDVNQVDDEVVSNDLIDKVLQVTNNTLDSLLDGEIAIENAQELIATIQAVKNAIELNNTYKNA